ncbi:MAG: hypothetical protein PSN34_11060 [Urechidicola sp.]|nr:hypothetical protein [Urechidicola sp.]
MKNNLKLLVTIVLLMSVNFTYAEALAFDACLSAAETAYFINYWNEGYTYASTVFQQTVSWCQTMYL